MRDDPAGGVLEICGDVVGVSRPWRSVPHRGILSGAGTAGRGANQNGAASRPPAGLDVGRRVADDDGCPKVEVPFVRGTYEHPGVRLTAFAYAAVRGEGSFGMVRAVVDGIDFRASGAQHDFKGAMNLPETLLGDQPAGDNRLVCGYDEPPAGAVEAGQSLRNMRKKPELIDGCEVVDILDQDPIPVEEHGAAETCGAIVR